MVHDHSVTFGELLHTLRKRAGLTQQQLAGAIGMHRHAVGRWEQGEVLPSSRAIVLELARHLHLDDQETRHLFDASLTAPTPLWSVPLPRNPIFTGREAVLDMLHASLSAKQATVDTSVFALQGLGGIGKTQIALEYAYQYAPAYNAIFWIEAETIERVFSSLQRIAELLHLPEGTAANQYQMVEAVQRWLATHDHWLLIWDNLEDLALLTRLLPPSRQGMLLLTTRQQALGTLARGINLQPMDQEEALLFLLRRAKVLESEATGEQVLQWSKSRPAEYTAAVKLVILLDGLPLALDQAGAYLEETGCGLNDYLRHYERQRAFFLDRRGKLEGDHPQSVTVTFRLSLEQVEQRQQGATDLLRVCAFLHAEAIPEELFDGGVAHLESTCTSINDDPIHFDLALAALRNLSLVQRHAETRTLSLHRLVQVVLREQMEPAEERLWSEQVIRLVNAAFPDGSFATWVQCERYLAQALACVPLIALADNAVSEAVDLLSRVGRYLMRRGRMKEAEPLVIQSVILAERQYGSDSPHFILPLMVRAELAWQQGKFAFAEGLLWRVLALEEQNLEPSNIQIANTLNLLALYSWEQGKYTQAEPLYQRALHIWEDQACPSHPDHAFLLHHLALLSWKHGRYEQARSLYRRALHIFEQTVGPDHPHMAFSLLGLAALHMELGEYTQAEQLFQRTLQMREQALGSEHPSLAYSLNGLASLRTKQGRYRSAELLYRRGLRLREQALGFDHPEVSYSLSGLAKLYAKQGQFAQAESLFQRALRLREQALETDHPDIASVLNNLATLYCDQGNDRQAEPLFQRALQIRERRLGPSHLKTGRTLAALANLYIRQGREDLARALSDRACAIFIQDGAPTDTEMN